MRKRITKSNKKMSFFAIVHQYRGAVVVLQYTGVVVVNDVFVLTAVVVVALLVVCATFVSRKILRNRKKGTQRKRQGKKI